MKNVTAQIKCPGCGLQQTVGFRAPRLFEPSLFEYECRDCDSVVLAKAIRPQRKDNPNGDPVVRLQTKVKVVGELLGKMRAEEAAEHQGEAP